MPSEYLDLGKQIEEIEGFQQQWVEELQAYYGEQERDGFEEPPHERIRRRAEELVRTGFEHLYSNERGTTEMGDASPQEVHLLLLAIGAEVALNAVMLKEDWETYQNSSKFDNGETPGLKATSKWLMSTLPDGFGNEECKRVYQVLRLLRVHRNNSAHLGYARFTHPNHLKEIYHVLAFIFDHYFDESDVVDELIERTAEQEQWCVSDLDYPPVDLGVDSKRNTERR